MTKPVTPSALTEEDRRSLRRSSLFGRLDEDNCQRLLHDQPVSQAPKGARLYDWGEPAAKAYVVLSGLVKLFRADDHGEGAVLSIQGPGRMLGLAEGLSGRAFSASAETVSEARLLTIDVSVLRARIAGDPKLSLLLLAAASLDLRHHLTHLEELKAMSGAARLAMMILRLSEAHSGATQVTLPYEKRLIAGRLGMTPESFSRVVLQLRAHGVTARRDRLDIADVARLRAFALGGR